MKHLLRRQFLLAMPVFLFNCKSEERCKTCGMKIDRSSRWLTLLEAPNKPNQPFDTPKCAFQAWRTERKDATALVVRGYYNQEEQKDSTLLFATGSDVLGPMGIDFVPVEFDLAEKFKIDHNAKKMLKSSDISLEIVKDLSLKDSYFFCVAALNGLPLEEGVDNGAFSGSN